MFLVKIEKPIIKFTQNLKRLNIQNKLKKKKELKVSHFLISKLTKKLQLLNSIALV